MSQSKLFIPKTIRVGYQKREDTYTGNLAYVIYFDAKNKLRKEKSWLGWCHLPEGYDGARKHWRNTSEGIDPSDFDNVPTSGFVLNKTAGGGNCGWHGRNKCVRIYDPRGFELEITVENLIFILQHVDCSKGKGLEGEFVYSWDGADLVLLPACTVDYKESAEFTKLQDNKFSLRDLKPGYSYKTKDNRDVIYIGRYRKYKQPGYYSSHEKFEKKGHIFWNDTTFEMITSGNKLSHATSEIEVSNFSDLVQRYESSGLYNKPVRLFLQDKPEDFEEEVPMRPMWYIQRGDEFISVSICGYRDKEYSTHHRRWISGSQIRNKYMYHDGDATGDLSDNGKTLFVEFEGGKSFPIHSSYC